MRRPNNTAVDIDGYMDSAEGRLEIILKRAQAEIVPFEHKNSKKELLAHCTVDICENVLCGNITEEQLRAVGPKAFNWFQYICNLSISYEEEDNRIKGRAKFLNYRYRSLDDYIPMLQYHAELYYRAAQNILKQLDKKNFK